MRQRLASIGMLMAAGLLLAACAGLHLYDKSQEPVITVGSGLRPVITWTPAEAYELNVYEGSEDGNGFGVTWTVRGGGDFANNLRSPVTYGVPPPGSEMREAPPLEPGKTYTVSIYRKDPKGGGDGFTETGHRYVSTKTFVASD
jgi:hypothetical protein